MSTNEIRGVCHAGFGQGHMGRSGRGHGYYSSVCVCAQESWGEGMGYLAGKLGTGTVWFVIRFRVLSQLVLE
nr:hypothetical protein [Tanacetum cinerariifolium]